MPSKRVQARWLVSSLRTGEWSRAALSDRIMRAAKLDVFRSAKLAARLCFHFGERIPPEDGPLLSFLLAEPLLQAVYENGQIQGPLLDHPVMDPRPDNFLVFALPSLCTWQDVARWLGLFDEELAWFADWRDQQHKVTEQKLHHYRYAWVPKRTGGLRLIEKPKSRLKIIQGTILKEILNRVPAHHCAHGFTRGHSIKTSASHHVGQEALLRMDLKNFFHSVPISRVYVFYRRLGYPRTVARLLQGLSCNAVSPALAGSEFGELSWLERKRLQSRHLPQGAPTSGALANLCAWRLDCRLEGLAQRYGYIYTRYADDIAFSGPRSLAKKAKFLESLIASIATEEGFAVNHRKTRLKLASQRQRLTGIVVNAKTNYDRREWDRLKATLHNCVIHGPESQNRGGHANFKAHLEGRVAHVTWLNASRGAKLESLLRQIQW